MYLWPGIQLIGAGHRCLKGMFYEVAAVDDVHVELTNGLKLTHEQALKSLRLSYALTYASCQGLTLKGVVRLDTQSPNFTLKHLYVGISRATSASLVEVV
jgi:ATP-dependent exoDNAse (exonuclease V) alpha subunit